MCQEQSEKFENTSAPESEDSPFCSFRPPTSLYKLSNHLVCDPWRLFVPGPGQGYESFRQRSATIIHSSVERWNVGAQREDAVGAARASTPFGS